MLITVSSSHSFRPGDAIIVGGRSHVIKKVLTHTSFTVRRTFWQWLQDLFSEVA